MEISSAVILAGGFGTRLQSVVQNIPKPMAPIKGKPFLEHLFIYLLKNNITEVVLSVGYLHETIISHFGNKYGKQVEIGNRIEYRELNIAYAVEDTPLGTGGAIKFALSKSKENCSFVLNGDSFFNINLQSLSDFYFEKNVEIAIALRKVDDIGRYGSVEIDLNNAINSFCEKGAKTGAGLINAGVYILNKNLLNDYPEKFSFEKDFMEKQNQQIYGLSFDDDFIDIGIPEDYYRAAEMLLPYSSALFLDRDGVINKRIVDGYVTKLEEFIFLDGAILAIKEFSFYFDKIFVVSNQQGVGKGIMTCEDVEKVNDFMLETVAAYGGRIDKVYFSPYLQAENHSWRKPNTGMALQAKKDFPAIDLERSIMIGDSESDIIFGKQLNMKTVFIGEYNSLADINCDSLAHFASTL